MTIYLFIYYENGCCVCFLLQIVSDSASKHKVYYTISGSGVDMEPTEVFSLKSTTGEFFLLQAIDRETYPRFEVSHTHSTSSCMYLNYCHVHYRV